MTQRLRREVQRVLNGLRDAEALANRYADTQMAAGRTEGREHLRAEGLIADLLVAVDDLREAMNRDKKESDSQ